ncbi:dTDP-4-dehydrorhamnose reductase [Shewanella profunda]|uniref:dTDP-4-dehydrorhamnose reductase n=1 Tax=Shewanella profunda TaxID=254793 RepID=UPI00200E9841|nr:dTDP-4-dehydrorhamnose reductase [Shewanella profunda]MCL1088523.1 dTDP-4-dehydrorhamnose reductase [Shewanella profunda]
MLKIKGTVLITGANSQLAKALQRTAKVALDGLDTGMVKLVPLSHPQLDITDAYSIETALIHYRPQWVINCAAYNAVDNAEQNPAQAHRVNAIGPELLAKHCLLTDTRLVHISSDYVFGGAVNHHPIISLKPHMQTPYQETDKSAPLSIYGQSKLAGEDAVLDALGKRAMVIRTAWLYGQDGHNFVNTMLKLMQTQSDLKVIDDQFGSPTWSDALARVIWQLIAKQGAGLFHYTGQGECSWYEFACEIQRQAFELKYLTKMIPIAAVNALTYSIQAECQLARRPSYSVLNSDKLRTFLMPISGCHTIPIEWQDWRCQLNTMLRQCHSGLDQTEQHPSL